MRSNWPIIMLAFALVMSAPEASRAADDGIVRIKSAYSMPETVKRLKKDVADKGIMFFDEIDQSKLAADAGVKLRPSTLLVFGNPQLGTLFLTSNPAAGLDWPVRLLVYQDESALFGSCIRTLRGLRTATESWIAMKPLRRHRT